MISKREIHDVEMELRRTEGDGECAAILAARAREEEQKSQIQTAENRESQKRRANIGKWDRLCTCQDLAF